MASPCDPLRYEKEEFSCWLDKHPDIYKELRTILYKIAILDKSETVQSIKEFLDKYGRDLMLNANIFRLQEYLIYYETCWKTE